MSLNPILYRDMLDVAVSELSSSGIGYDRSRELAVRIVTQFCRTHGDKIYRVPTLKSLSKIERDKIIREQSKSMSVAKIARAHGLAQWTVRDILNE